MVFGEHFTIQTKGFSDIKDITGMVQDIVIKSRIRTGLTAPVSDGNLVLGTWQQIVVIDHDNRPHSRKIFIQVMGE
ncbi:MAG TPA: hypothetical protein ENH24_04975 [Nitrospirae bacterium]|nr:hypothetical protein [Nitrospirota bacterium]